MYSETTKLLVPEKKNNQQYNIINFLVPTLRRGIEVSTLCVHYLKERGALEREKNGYTVKFDTTFTDNSK